MAGVPSIMQAMLDAAAGELETGEKIVAETIEAGGIPEGRYGDALSAIATAHPGVSIGSYPSFADGRFSNQIVVRAKEPAKIAAAREAIAAMIADLKAHERPL
jgi:molybdopterin-biosynthesis enzyme MoeA-like protein